MGEGFSIRRSSHVAIQVGPDLTTLSRQAKHSYVPWRRRKAKQLLAEMEKKHQITVSVALVRLWRKVLEEVGYVDPFAEVRVVGGDLAMDRFLHYLQLMELHVSTDTLRELSSESLWNDRLPSEGVKVAQWYCKARLLLEAQKFVAERKLKAERDRMEKCAKAAGALTELFLAIGEPPKVD